MRINYPEYYHRFRCIAAECPDSCCKEWAVDVDAEAARYYRELPGALGDRLREVLQDTEDGTVMQIENRRCPMWRQDGLCRIQAELGHDALCKTCRDFPRIRHDYGDFVELGLELSCPEAARLILAETNYDIGTEECGGGEAPDYDKEVMAALQESRREVRAFLSSESYSVSETLAIILLYGHGVQAWLDGGEGEPLDPSDCLAQAKKYAGPGNMTEIVGFFKELEILTEEWRQRLETPLQPFSQNKTLRALVRYMIDRYWLQAISDYDLVSRVKLTVVACLLVGTLGGDPVQTVQQFSKEIENDPDNVEAILDGAYTAPALTDRNLLGILLG